jgi:excisionase family DNA binding protein
MDELLTVEEVTRYLRLHPMTVQRWCRTGSLPAAKIGKAYRIKRDHLQHWWEERTAHTSEEPRQPATAAREPIGAD